MKKIAVIGAGTMGNGIAHVFAQKGFEVHIIDTQKAALDKAMATIEKNLDRQINKGTINSEDKANTLQNITAFTSIELGIVDVDLAVEAATENSEIKKNIFRLMDEKANPTCILATNTSSIPIAQLAAVTNRPEKVIGMHFMNPVPVMKLVEIIRGYKTSDATAAAVVAMSKELGKIPVECNDFPGFVANRILMPMINEAIETLQTGVGSVEAIDSIMKLGMAHPMGPLQLADFIGLDVCLSILRVLHEGMGQPKYAPNPLLVAMVTAGDLGVKSGRGFYDYANGTKDAPVAPNFL